MQLGALADLYLYRICRGQLGHDFQLLGIHHLHNAGFNAYTLAILHKTLGNLAVHGAGDDGIGHRLAGCICSGLSRSQIGAGRIQIGLRRHQCRGGNKAFLHQRHVVVMVALGNGQLRSGGIGLLLRLAQAGLGLSGINACQLLAFFDAIALTHGKPAQLASHIGLHHRRIHRLHNAVDGHGQRKLAGLHSQHFLSGDLNRQLQRSRAGLKRLFFVLLIDGNAPARDGQQADNDQAHGPAP